MKSVNLAPGQHSISMSLANHNLLTAIISVSSTGAVSCVSVSGGSCGDTTPPGIVVSGITIIGYLKESLEDVCAWVAEKGGAIGIATFDIMSLIKGYSGETDLGFSVMSADIMGAIAYYSGNVESGNELMKCSY